MSGGESLNEALYRLGVVIGHGESRRLFNQDAIKINGRIAISLQQVVFPGDDIRVGKTRSFVV